MREIVLMADVRVAAIPVIECGEPLVDVASVDSICIDHRHAGVNSGWRRLRESLLGRLSIAADSLPAGLRLLHVEGYRPPVLQAHYFQAYCDELRTARPGLGPVALEQLASRHIAPPEIAPHSAGAAIDLTLCNCDGNELDLGTAIDATPEASANACYTAAENINQRARTNRAILSTAMRTAGFVNYPTEWWHWSFGDRYWAWETEQATARYATVLDR